MRILKIALIFAGTVLGAGFASGQEIMIFFARFKPGGTLGAVISGILIALTGSLICRQSKQLGTADYISYLKSLFCEPLANVIYFITQLFMFISFTIMVSGSGELLHTQFNLPKLFGEILTLLICFLCLANRVDGIAKLNLILTPVMSVGILTVSVASVFRTEHAWAQLGALKENFPVSACLYMSYNILSAAAVLVTSASIAGNAREAAAGGAAGGAILMLVMVFSTLALITVKESIHNAEFPMLTVAEGLNKALIFVYPPLIYMAMLTTAVSSGFCACEVLIKCGLGEKAATFVLCLGAIPLSAIRFSSLIKNSYVLFGFLGLILIAGILIKSFKNKEIRRK